MSAEGNDLEQAVGARQDWHSAQVFEPVLNAGIMPLIPDSCSGRIKKDCHSHHDDDC